MKLLLPSIAVGLLLTSSLLAQALNPETGKPNQAGPVVAPRGPERCARTASVRLPPDSAATSFVPADTIPATSPSQIPCPIALDTCRRRFPAENIEGRERRGYPR